VPIGFAPSRCPWFRACRRIRIAFFIAEKLSCGINTQTIRSLKVNALTELALAGVLMAVCDTGCAFADSASRVERPSAKMLQAGDLLWPKPPDAVVPYNSHPGRADQSDEDRWDSEKQAYLDSLLAKPTPSKEEKARYKVLSGMTYQEFLARYENGLEPGESVPAGTGFVSTGHVAIVHFIHNKPYVVEAAMKKGVRETSYANWLNERPIESVWLGRLRGVSSKKRAKIGDKAASYLHKRYNFWNFNLKDDSVFYCSKLAWLCIYSATSEPPDGNPNPNRLLWYSPKQLMNSPHVEVLFNPGSYGTPVRRFP